MKKSFLTIAMLFSSLAPLAASAHDGHGGGHGGGHFPPPSHHHHYVCYARNLRGQVFSAVGHDTYFTQQAAVSSCAASSAVCRPAGCTLTF